MASATSRKAPAACETERGRSCLLVMGRVSGAAGGGRASLLSIVNGLGSSYRPAGTFSALYDDRRHDGADAYRGFSFVDSCTCFRYVSPPAAVA